MANHSPKLGDPIICVESVSSTNDMARDMAISGAAEGLCVIAREQTSGRGRQGRSWSSPSGEGLYLSVVLRPEVKAAESALITLSAAIAVAESLRLDFNVLGDIKWPNDVLVKGRKICGILVEAAIEGDRLQYAIMGIGVNVGQRSFPEEVGDRATSVLLETGNMLRPDDFAEALIPRLEQWYAAALSQPDRVIMRWEELSPTSRGCSVRVESADTVVEGVTRGLTTAGALMLELANGERYEVVSGDVKVRPTSS